MTNFSASFSDLHFFFCPLQKLLEAHEEQNSEAFTEAVSPVQALGEGFKTRPSASVGIPAAELDSLPRIPCVSNKAEGKLSHSVCSLAGIHVPVVQDGRTVESEPLEVLKVWFNSEERNIPTSALMHSEVNL